MNSSAAVGRVAEDGASVARALELPQQPGLGDGLFSR
jgi:hypothetical protein